MMNPTEAVTTRLRSIKIRRDYGERLRSLLQDGYKVRHSHEGDDYLVTRLHHMCNGNDIILTANLHDGVLSQKTNHILTYLCNYR